MAKKNAALKVEDIQLIAESIQDFHDTGEVPPHVRDELAERFETSNHAIDIGIKKAWKLLDEIDNIAGIRYHANRKINELNNELMAVRRQNKKAMGLDDLADAITSACATYIQPLPPLRGYKPTKVKKGAKLEHVVMHLSDEHADQVVHLKDTFNQEIYNFERAMRRGERYVEQVIEYTQQMFSNRIFPVLWILAYGDHVSGEIHGSTQHSTFQSPTLNAFAVGDLHAQMIRELAPYFEKVNVVYVPGNHGRMTPKKDYNGPENNWDFVVGTFAKARCSDLSNVEIEIPRTFQAIVKILGWNFVISHGDDIRAWGGLPFYGISKRNQKLQAILSKADIEPHYRVMGHFHQPASLSDAMGATIINGSWRATDAWTINSIMAYNRPMQLLNGVSEADGMTWQIPIYLRPKKVERVEKPLRYTVTAFTQDTLSDRIGDPTLQFAK